MNNIRITQFETEFYNEVFALWQQCEGVGLNDADSRESTRAYLRRNPGMSFVAVAGGRIVGAILAGHDGRRGFLHHLAVHPGFRRRGVGRRLVDHCLEALHAARIGKAHLFVFNANSDGIAFWKSAGWAFRSDVAVMSRSTGTEN